MEKSLVVGATGLVGTHLLKELSKKNFSVSALSRRPIMEIASNINVVEINFDLLNQISLPECDHVYICLGTTIKKAGSQKEFKKVDLDYSLLIAKKCIEKDVKKISLISSVGAHAQANNFYLKTKGIVEEEIINMNFSMTNIYRPSLLIGQRNESRYLEGLGQEFAGLINPFLRGSLKKFRSVKAEKLAASMAKNFNANDGVNYFYFEDF